MIQFNLLPDVKIQYIKTKRTRRMVIVSSIAIAGVSMLLLIITFSYRAAQSKHLTDLNKDTYSLKSELEGNADLTKMLSIQSQIAALPALYNNRPAAIRLSEYIEKTTPSSVNLSKMSLDFTAGTIEVTGVSDSVSSVNRYVDVLRFAKFTSMTDDQEKPSAPEAAFTEVVLSRFSKDKATTGKPESVSFVVSFKFNLLIFDATKTVDLQVPNTTTTHNQPGGIFNGAATDSIGQEGVN